MNINLAAYTRYAYTGSKRSVSNKTTFSENTATENASKTNALTNDVSNNDVSKRNVLNKDVSQDNVPDNVSDRHNISDKNTIDNKTKKYPNVVKDFKKRHPDKASHVSEQVQAGKSFLEKCGADDVSRSDMTMDEYKTFFRGLMDRIPCDSSQINNTRIWSITDKGWEQMKNDPDYEAWVLGYNIEDCSVHFPFQTSNVCIEKFGATIDEHIGQGIPKNEGKTDKADKKENSWWEKRQKRMKELLKEQQEEAYREAAAKRRELCKQHLQERANESYKIQQEYYDCYESSFK